MKFSEIAKIKNDSELFYDLPIIQHLDDNNGYLIATNNNNYNSLYSSEGVFLNGGFLSVDILYAGDIAIPKIIFEKYIVIYDPINNVNNKVKDIVQTMGYYDNNLCIEDNEERFYMMKNGAIFLIANDFDELVEQYTALVETD